MRSTVIICLMHQPSNIMVYKKFSNTVICWKIYSWGSYSGGVFSSIGQEETH